jgi:hypothetical protein
MDSYTAANSTDFHGTHVPVEELSTTSLADNHQPRLFAKVDLNRSQRGGRACPPLWTERLAVLD